MSVGQFGECCCAPPGLKQMALRVYWQTVFPYVPEAQLPGYIAANPYRKANYQKVSLEHMYYGETKTWTMRFDQLKGHWVVAISYSSSEAGFEAAKAQFEADGPFHFYDVIFSEDFNSIRRDQYERESGDLVRYEWRRVFDEVLGEEWIVNLSEARAFLGAQSWDAIPVGIKRVWDLTHSDPPNGAIIDDLRDYDPSRYRDMLLEATSEVVFSYTQMCVNPASPGYLSHGSIFAIDGYFDQNNPPPGGSWWLEGYILRTKGVPSPHCEAVFPQLRNGPMIDTGFPDTTFPPKNLFEVDMACPAAEYEPSEIACGQANGEQVNEPDTYQIILIPRNNQHLFPCC